MKTVAFALGLAVSFQVTSAHAAEPREQQLAQALFDEGRQLMEAKRYGDACPKLAESQRLDPGGGTLLNLAVCHEKEGKLASAQAELHDALSLAIRDGRKDRQDLARERLAVVEPKVPRVSVVVAPEAEVDGLEVKLDGLVLRRAAWGVAAPVDPGLHRVEATAPGLRTFRVDVPIDVAEKKTVRVPSLSSTGDPGPPVVVTAPPSTTTAAAPTGSAPVEKVRMNPLFYAAIGVAVVGGVVAAVTGEVALSANSTAKDGCNFDRHYCKDQASIDAASRARTMAWVSTGALAVGVAGAVGILVIPANRAGTTVGFAPAPGGGSLQLRGSF
jgi:hypothetical protein